MADVTLWGIHGGRTGDADSLFLKKGFVAVGWAKLGDLSKLAPTRHLFAHQDVGNLRRGTRGATSLRLGRSALLSGTSPRRPAPRLARLLFRQQRPCARTPPVKRYRAMQGYKYAIHLSQIPDCPPKGAPAGGIAYRVVHNPIVDNDFVPTAVVKGEGGEHCDAWGISLFTTQQALVKKWSRLLAKYPHLRNDVGGHVASGTLDASHGHSTTPNKDRHFNLHEFVGVALAPLFEIVSSI